MRRGKASARPPRRSSRINGDAPQIQLPAFFPPSQSPLILLPNEVRNMIWKLVLADVTIHIDFTEENEVEYWTDEDNDTEETAKILLINDVRSNYQTRVNKWFANKDPDKKFFHVKTHLNSTYALHTNHAIQMKTCCSHSKGSFDVSLLLVNKFIYAETSLIPYAENTFLFTAPLAFQRFFQTTTIAQRQDIKKLSINVIWTDEGTNHHARIPPGPHIGYWNVVLRPGLIMQLSSLRTLYLELHEDFTLSWSSLDDSFEIAEVRGVAIGESLLNFKELKLDKAHVIIVHTDPYWHTHVEENGHGAFVRVPCYDRSLPWTLAEPQKMANDLGDALTRKIQVKKPALERTKSYDNLSHHDFWLKSSTRWM